MEPNVRQPIKANDWNSQQPATSVYSTNDPKPTAWAGKNPNGQAWTDPNDQQPGVEYFWDDTFYTWDDSRIFWV